jgi:UDP-2,3-diacylglucosamine hydrolase
MDTMHQNQSANLFISDLHLADEHPAISALFFRFVNEIALGAQQLFILGDLFEYWVGDDQLDHDPLARDVAKALAGLAASGVRIFFMRGNRDFLVGERFAETCGLTLLDDPHAMKLHDKRVLLMHGDSLCTDDVAYQQFRALTRSESWQRETLAKPYAERHALARAIRSQSDTAKSQKSNEIMDVTQATVDETFRRFQFPTIIHGHTHRPARHLRNIDGHETIRWVLPDWRDRSYYLRASPDIDNAIVCEIEAR